METKLTYEKICKEHYLPIFYQPWWLDAVCGENGWNVLLSRDKGGNVQGVLPYHTFKKYGFSFNMQPMLTPFLGPWLLYSEDQKLVRRYSFEKKVMTELLTQLPVTSYYRQQFHYTQQNWLPFYWNDYKQTTRYTYVLENIKEHEALRKMFKSSIRNRIKKGHNEFEVKIEHDIDVFYALNVLTFERQGVKIPYSKAFLQTVDEVLLEKRQRRIFTAYDKKDKAIASVYIVWDEKSAYSIALSKDYNSNAQGAIPLLLWEAIKYTSEFVDVFDFEGSMMETIERFYSSFGAKQKPYFAVYKSKNFFVDILMRLKFPKLV